MKIKSTATKILLALVGGVLVAQPGIAGSASSPAYNPDDLLLGFRASGGTGATQDYLADLGPVSSLSTTAVQQINIGATGSNLSTLFGASWSTRSDIFWSISGSSGSSAAGTDPARTLYATSPETTPGTAAPALLLANSSAQSGPSNKIGSVGNAYVQTAGTANSFASGTSAAIIQTTTAVNSYASFQTGAISYSYFSPTIEGTFANGVAGSILDLYQLIPAAGANIGTPGTLVGRFILNSSGNLTFIPKAVIGTSQVQLAVSTDTVLDNVAGGNYVVTVTRTGDVSSAASVTLSTADGTAKAGTDYTAVTGQTVSFGINEVSKTVNVPITDLAGYQADRSFTVTLSNPIGGTTIGTNAVETVTITDPITPSVINFASGITYTTGQSAGTVTLQFVRSGGSSPVTATISGGAAGDTAVLGTDYSIPNATVSFAANSNTATLVINILNVTAAEPNKQFTVTLTGAGLNASVGTTTVSAVVTIFANDTKAPTVSISGPAASATITGTVGGTVNVTGTATDDKGVNQVLVSLNGGSFVSATLVSPLGLLTGYSYTLTPVGGLNTVQVESVDGKGNVSPVATVKFTYVVKLALTVNITGPGTVTGKLPIYQVGNTYTLTAVPTAVPADIFNGWSGTGLAAPAAALPKLTFVFTDALAKTPVISAAFIANPFAAAGIVGSFNGLVSADTAHLVVPSNENTGFITLTVTNQGSFTGTLKIGGQSLPLAGQFDNSGHAVFGAGRTASVAVPRTGEPSLLLSGVSVDLSPTGTHQITGTIGEEYRQAVLPWSTVVADRAAYSAASPVASPYTVNKGYYTVVIPAQKQPFGSDLTTLDYPQGDGIGSITVTPAGLVTLTGTLADGAAVTASAPLSAGLTSPLFAQLYAANGGSFSGLVKLDTTQTNHDLSGTGFLWFKPYVGGQIYPYGWPEGVTTAVYGAKYAAVAGQSVVPGLTVVVPPTTNAALTFSDGGLDSSITKDVNISPLNVVTKTTSTDLSYTLTLSPTTGKFGGSFTHTDGTKPAFSGIVFNKLHSAYNGGYGFFLTTTPKVIDGTGQSGGVSLGSSAP